GSVSTVMEEDLQKQPVKEMKDPLVSYNFNDTIGRGGLEAMCEPTLRGRRGKLYRGLDGEEDDVEFTPVPGGDVRTTIDIALQDQIQKMFEHMQVPSNLDPKTTFEVAMH